MTSAKSQETIALKNSTLPTRDDAYTTEVKADPGIAGYQTVLAAAQPRPELPEYSSLWGPLDTELLAIMRRQEVPRQGPRRRGDRDRQAGPGLQQVTPSGRRVPTRVPPGDGRGGHRPVPSPAQPLIFQKVSNDDSRHRPSDRQAPR